MKKILIPALVLILAAGGFWYWKPDTAQQILDRSSLSVGPSAARVYKWRDAQGGWHITSEAPPSGVEYEIREYRSDLNILPVPPQLKDKE